MNDLKTSYIYPSRQRLEISHGDLTTEKVDAIVNAANGHLMHGGGIAAIIAQKGGETIYVESSQWVQTHGLVTHESPAYTGAGKLPCRYVIHAVGPVWGSGNEDTKLAVAIESSLKLAEELGLTSIAFPAISTGIYHFPVARAAGVFYETLQHYFETRPTSTMTLVRIVLYDQSTLSQFLNVFTAWLAAHSRP